MINLCTIFIAVFVASYSLYFSARPVKMISLSSDELLCFFPRLGKKVSFLISPGMQLAPIFSPCFRYLNYLCSSGQHNTVAGGGEKVYSEEDQHHPEYLSYGGQTQAIAPPVIRRSLLMRC